MSGHLLQYLRGGKTAVIGDTLECLADYLKTKAIAAVGAITATTSITAGTTLADANGTIQNRRYVYQFAEQDISAAGATVVGPVMPVAATLLKAYYIQTEANAAEMATGVVQLGLIDADGSSNGDVDKFTLGTTAENGLLVASAAVGTVVDLPLATTAIAAGKRITATHVQQAVAGKVIQVVEYALG
jgi:hypothetical protein